MLLTIDLTEVECTCRQDGQADEFGNDDGFPAGSGHRVARADEERCQHGDSNNEADYLFHIMQFV